MILAVEADGHFTIGGTRYPIQSGMLFYIPPGVEQTIEPRAQSPEHYLTAHFSASRVKLNSEGKWELQENIRALKQPAAQKITDYEPFEELFEKMLGTWDSKGPEYEFITGTYLRQLLIWLSQNNKNQNKSYAISLKVDQLMTTCAETSTKRLLWINCLKFPGYPGFIYPKHSRKLRDIPSSDTSIK
jgi:hypothetical protein